MSWQPWTFTEPFVAYTPILADEMNPKLNGISVSLTYIATELNNFIPRMPSNYTGSIIIPETSYTSCILGTDDNGNMTLIDQASFLASQKKDFLIKRVSDAITLVGGDNHGDWLVMDYTSETGNIEVVVGPAIETAETGSAAAIGATIIFTQDSTLTLTFVEAEGVTIKSPGHLRAYGPNSTVTLVAIDQYTWILGGDVFPSELIV